MNHSKIILLACISGFVALTTAWLGVTGTIIGSVLSSVLYNVLSEILQKPVEERKFSFNFEYEIAYVFPLIVIAFIQLLLLAAFLSQWGYLPGTFLNAYLMIQGVVDNNLYRILGFALLVMGVYPFIIKPNIVKKSYGVGVVFVGLIFLARGFLDANTSLISLYEFIFQYFDFQIEILAFMILAIIIILILNNASQTHKDFKSSKNKAEGGSKVYVKNSKKKLTLDDLDDLTLKEVPTKHVDQTTKQTINHRKKDVGIKKSWPIKGPLDNSPDINYKDDYFPAPQKNPLNTENQKPREVDFNKRRR